MYDVLHDPDYRAVWDENMVEGFNVEQIDANNDVGYYSAKVCRHQQILHTRLLMCRVRHPLVFPTVTFATNVRGE